MLALPRHWRPLSPPPECGFRRSEVSQTWHAPGKTRDNPPPPFPTAPRDQPVLSPSFSHIRSRWCAPSGMITDTTVSETSLSTPYADPAAEDLTFQDRSRGQLDQWDAGLQSWMHIRPPLVRSAQPPPLRMSPNAQGSSRPLLKTMLLAVSILRPPHLRHAEGNRPTLMQGPRSPPEGKGHSRHMQLPSSSQLLLAKSSIPPSQPAARCSASPPKAQPSSPSHALDRGPKLPGLDAIRLFASPRLGRPVVRLREWTPRGDESLAQRRSERVCPPQVAPRHLTHGRTLGQNMSVLPLVACGMIISVHAW